MHKKNLDKHTWFDKLKKPLELLLNVKIWPYLFALWKIL